MAGRFDGYTVGMDESAVVTWPLDPSGRTGAISVRQLILSLQQEDPDASVSLVVRNYPRPCCGLLAGDRGVFLVCDVSAIAMLELNQKAQQPRPPRDVRPEEPS